MKLNFKINIIDHLYRACKNKGGKVVPPTKHTISPEEKETQMRFLANKIDLFFKEYRMIEESKKGIELAAYLFELEKTTPYEADHIIEFMKLTSLKCAEVEMLMKQFCRYGISNLKDINTLIKLGYFHYH